MIFRINKGQGTNMAEAGERAGRVDLKKKKYKQRKKKGFHKSKKRNQKSRTQVLLSLGLFQILDGKRAFPALSALEGWLL